MQHPDGVVQQIVHTKVAGRAPLDKNELRSFLSPERFSSFKLEHGELLWGDYDLCFPVIDLYRNCIERVDHLAQAA